MNIPILILEDDEKQAEVLQELILSYSASLEPVIAHTLEDARKQLATDVRFKAFFLDISLAENPNDTDGLQLAKQIAHTPNYRTTPMIFVTAFPEHIFDAVNQFHCYAYLLKPYTKKDIFRQLDWLFSESTMLRLRTLSGVYQKIDLDDIFYIQAFGRTIQYRTRQGELYSRQYNLKALESMLPDTFVRCHKSYIVNTAHVTAVSRHSLHLQEIGESIPNSRTSRFTL